MLCFLFSMLPYYWSLALGARHSCVPFCSCPFHVTHIHNCQSNCTVISSLYYCVLLIECNPRQMIQVGEEPKNMHSTHRPENLNLSYKMERATERTALECASLSMWTWSTHNYPSHICVQILGQYRRERIRLEPCIANNGNWKIGHMQYRAVISRYNSHSLSCYYTHKSRSIREKSRDRESPIDFVQTFSYTKNGVPRIAIVDDIPQPISSLLRFVPLARTSHDKFMRA